MMALSVARFASSVLKLATKNVGVTGPVLTEGLQSCLARQRALPMLRQASIWVPRYGKGSVSITSPPVTSYPSEPEVNSQALTVLGSTLQLILRVDTQNIFESVLASPFVLVITSPVTRSFINPVPATTGVLLRRSCQTSAIDAKTKSITTEKETANSRASVTESASTVLKRSHLYRYIAELNHLNVDRGTNIVSTSHVLEDQCLKVAWSDGQSQLFPYIWLRDNCLCKQCYQASLSSRTFSFTSLDVEMIPICAVPSDEGKTIRLTWPDGHSGVYPSDWLRQYRFENASPDVTFDTNLEYWDTSLMDSGTLRIFNFQDLVTSDEAIYEWLMEMKVTGICLVKGAGMMEGQVKRLGDRVLFLRSTYYGPTSHVVVKYNATNIAFTGKAFPMHTDLAFLHRPPGAQMIHCIEQAEGPGGENWFTDGFKVALDLKSQDPEAFDLLANTLLEFIDIGEDVYGRFHQHSRHPTISLDRNDNPDHIYLSDHGRVPMMRFPVKHAQSLYRALKKFSNKYHHPSNVCSYKLNEGDIMTFDNRRVIHGRGAFEVTSSSSRHLETGYLEWDEIDSRLRLLQCQFKEAM